MQFEMNIVVCAKNVLEDLTIPIRELKFNFFELIPEVRLQIKT